MNTEIKRLSDEELDWLEKHVAKCITFVPEFMTKEIRKLVSTALLIAEVRRCRKKHG